MTSFRLTGAVCCVDKQIWAGTTRMAPPRHQEVESPDA